MKLGVNRAEYKKGLIIVLSCYVFSACSRSSSKNIDSRGRTETAESKELKALGKKIAEYQKQTDDSGNVVTLPGFAASPLQQDDGVISAKDILTNPEANIFTYAPPLHVDTEFSESVMIADGDSMPTDVAEECQAREYSPKVPKLGQLPQVNGSYFHCIKLTHSSTQKQFYLKTPPIIVAVTKSQLKFVSEDCIDPDLSKLASGIELTMCDGSVGTGTYVAPAICTADGQVGCVNEGNYKSADTSAFGASNIISGSTIAGIAGSATAAPAACSADGATNCVAVTAYKAAKMANFDPAKIRSGTTIAGVAGSIADCSSNGQDTCFLDTANSYDAANLTNLSVGNIKSAVVIAGLTGDYPSATYPLPGASGGVADLSSPIDAQIKSATAFEFWDSTGTRIASAGDADITAAKIKASENIFGAVGTVTDAGAIDAWNLRVGVTVGSTTGALKVNCRNAVNPATFDSDTMPPGTADTTAGSTNDWWDTIDDSDSNANAIPTALVSAWTSDTHCDATNWEDMTDDGGGDTTCDEAADECVFKDKISGLLWSERQSAASDWSAAVSLCDGLNGSSFGGHATNWRLPTQKELMNAWIHGIRDLGYKGGTAGTASNNDDFIADIDQSFWSASSVSLSPSYAWFVYLGAGTVYDAAKADIYDVVCVR